jgi:hypothetical protein
MSQNRAAVQQQGSLVIAHNNPGIRVADAVAASSRIQTFA